MQLIKIHDDLFHVGVTAEEASVIKTLFGHISSTNSAPVVNDMVQTFMLSSDFDEIPWYTNIGGEPSDEDSRFSITAKTDALDIGDDYNEASITVATIR